MLLPYKLCRWVALAAIVVFLVSCFFGTAFSSITLAVIGGAALLGGDLKAAFLRLKQDKVAMALLAIFLIYLLSGLNSSNLHFYFFKLNQKLPFIIIPAALFVFFPVSEKLFNGLLAVFFISILFISAYSVFHFATHYQQVKEMYIAGKTMWTPRDHIRFSLAVVMSIWFGVHLFVNQFHLWNKFEKWIWLTGSILLTVYLHILSVRSGLLAFYIGVGYTIVYFLLIKKKLKYAIGIALLVPVLLIAAWNLSPNLATKIHYMQYDVFRFMNNEQVAWHSDGGRLLSQQMGFSLFKQHPVVGVGLGDIKDETNRIYSQLHPEVTDEHRLEPHNQFLFIAVISGFLGLLVFLTALLTIFLSNSNYRKWLFCVIYCGLLSSFMTETTIEMQLGTLLFLFFVVLLHIQLNVNSAIKP